MHFLLASKHYGNSVIYNKTEMIHFLKSFFNMIKFVIHNTIIQKEGTFSLKFKIGVFMLTMKLTVN